MSHNYTRYTWSSGPKLSANLKPAIAKTSGDQNSSSIRLNYESLQVAYFFASVVLTKIRFLDGVFGIHLHQLYGLFDLRFSISSHHWHSGIKLYHHDAVWPLVKISFSLNTNRESLRIQRNFCDLNKSFLNSYADIESRLYFLLSNIPYPSYEKFCNPWTCTAPSQARASAAWSWGTPRRGAEWSLAVPGSRWPKRGNTTADPGCRTRVGEAPRRRPGSGHCSTRLSYTCSSSLAVVPPGELCNGNSALD